MDDEKDFLISLLSGLQKLQFYDFHILTSIVSRLTPKFSILDGKELVVLMKTVRETTYDNQLLDKIMKAMVWRVWQLDVPDIVTILKGETQENHGPLAEIVTRLKQLGEQLRFVGLKDLAEVLFYLAVNFYYDEELIDILVNLYFIRPGRKVEWDVCVVWSLCVLSHPFNISWLTNTVEDFSREGGDIVSVSRLYFCIRKLRLSQYEDILEKWRTFFQDSFSLGERSYFHRTLSERLPELQEQFLCDDVGIFSDLFLPREKICIEVSKKRGCNEELDEIKRKAGYQVIRFSPHDPDLFQKILNGVTKIRMEKTN
jgi:hypothetical protein